MKSEKTSSQSHSESSTSLAQSSSLSPLFSPIKSVWEMSHYSIKEIDEKKDLLSHQILSFPYFYDAEDKTKPIQTLDNILFSKQESDRRPLLMGLKGRKIWCYFPENRSFQKGDKIDFKLVYDPSCYFDSTAPAHKSEDCLTFYLSSPCLFEQIEEEKHLYLEPCFHHPAERGLHIVIDSLTNINSQEKSALGTIFDQGELDEGWHTISSDNISLSLTPLTQIDQKTIHSKEFKDLCDYIVLQGVRNRDEFHAIKYAIFGNTATLRHPSTPLDEGTTKHAYPVNAKIILMIDSKEMMESLPDLISNVDGVWLNRLEIAKAYPIEQIHIIQKRFLKLCEEHAKISLISSDFLNSMNLNPNPTRAEVTDVANAIIDGTHSIVISRSISEGSNAKEAIQVLQEVIYNSCLNTSFSSQEASQRFLPNEEDIVAYGSVQIAETLKAKAIVCYTQGGFTPLKISSFTKAGACPIIALTHNYKIRRQLELVKNVSATILKEDLVFEKLLQETKSLLKKEYHFKEGDTFVFVSLSGSLLSQHRSNFFSLQEIKE